MNKLFIIIIDIITVSILMFASNSSGILMYFFLLPNDFPQCGGKFQLPAIKEKTLCFQVKIDKLYLPS